MVRKVTVRRRCDGCDPALSPDLQRAAPSRMRKVKLYGRSSPYEKPDDLVAFAGEVFSKDMIGRGFLFRRNARPTILPDIGAGKLLPDGLDLQTSCSRSFMTATGTRPPYRRPWRAADLFAKRLPPAQPPFDNRFLLSKISACMRRPDHVFDQRQISRAGVEQGVADIDVVEQHMRRRHEAWLITRSVT